VLGLIRGQQLVDTHRTTISLPVASDYLNQIHATQKNVSGMNPGRIERN
jgi:hypothetical protein